MRNLEQAMALATLGECTPQEPERRIRTAAQATEAIFADAAERKHDPFVNIEPETWCRRWLASKRFYLMRVPLNCVALPCTPRDMNYMLKRIGEDPDKNSLIGPVTVDINKPGVGRTPSGYVPPICVVDGKHRFASAVLRGSSYIPAWVGELAAERIKDRGVIERARLMVNNRPAKTRFDSVLELHADSNVEPLHHILGRALGQDPTMVREMIARYKQVHAHGRFGVLKERMNAVSPPGWSHTVEKMKDHPEIDNPFALAWHMHDQGYRPQHKEK